MTSKSVLSSDILSCICKLPSNCISDNMKSSCTQTDKLLSERKNNLFRHAKGSVLEIGAGTGLNRKYIKSDNYLALEPNIYFQNELDKITKKIIHSSAENIPLPSNSIDTVICSMTLCSVTYLDRVLSEIYRVLKPKGEFILLEHIAAPKGTWLRFWQRLLRPIFKVLDNGCQIDRDIPKAIHNSKFQPFYWEEFDLRLRTPFVQNWLIARLIK